MDECKPLGAGGGMAVATQAKRTASAAAALTAQTMKNAKGAKETADAVYAAAQAGPGSSSAFRYRSLDTL